MAQPTITIEQVQHLLSGADTHVARGSYNQQLVYYQCLLAIVHSNLLIAQELDQIGDIMAYQAGLKTKDEITIT